MTREELWTYFYVSGIFWALMSVLICGCSIPTADTAMMCSLLLGALISIPFIVKFLTED